MSLENKTKSPKSSEDHQALATMRKVLFAESEGLRLLADSLDKTTENILTRLSSLQGRIIVTGMGKSGHIARKIASSLTSMGLPAHFLHPAEASHGDLGMISEDDAVIALSKSGDTRELQDIVTYTRRFSVLLVAICGRKDARLVQEADFTVLLPDIAEAGALGLAPTTSTTMMLGFGDALAVALSEMAGNNAQSFGRYHPGGQLGRGFIRVRELMSQGEDIPLCSIDTPMSQALLTMTGKRFGCIGVIDAQRRLIGVITDGDLRRHMGKELLSQKVRDVMTSDPHRIVPDDLAAVAVRKMNQAQITNLFVTDAQGIVCGVLHIHDCLCAGVLSIPLD